MINLCRHRLESGNKGSVDEQTEQYEIAVPTANFTSPRVTKMRRIMLRNENAKADMKLNKQRYPYHTAPAAPQAVMKKLRFR